MNTNWCIQSSRNVAPSSHCDMSRLTYMACRLYVSWGVVVGAREALIIRMAPKLYIFNTCIYVLIIIPYG
jgi:hypothetical protein